MARAGESQSSLSPKILLSQAALSRRLCGFTSFTVDELARIAEALKVPIGTLLAEASKAVAS
ncbi:helix-turn-helix domain-containing protein [Mycobacteroides abscessus]|uniref:helix-turn-helix domain-containing protein n=1 Tax=Mycobacteroides abscessus TaxID=36809 RepID=UPI0005DCB8EF|nr:helix-turn-helix domain-containing protein [Mycobacteroides abscessus]ALM19587.1 hypothetical protein AOY11_18455 [Mycobacteroides abscessus]AMU52096.1 hypothetical protein A3O01_19510 [Mycobacteroides abscessus]ANO10781.1 hypothetical protein BAB76_19520 [Mycobacteroides abscessus]MBN7436050.1 helix-turn-helix domain-containing protein [Mycobacteroides abscessus subsp. abscessus]MDM3919213.1 helix-turn-helix domain-containing protein [Mycobacteroides abscessus]